MNRITLSKESTEIIYKALKHYIVTVLDMYKEDTEESELADELLHTFRYMCKENNN